MGEATTDTQFVGAAQPLTPDGLSAACDELSVAPAVLWSVLSVETSGCGFLSSRQPQILFERHVFSRLTGGKYDASHPDVSNPTAGGYAVPSSDQFVRLGEALALDRDAALQSASWGIGQVMGENFASANCPDVETMVAWACAGESEQLACMGDFILANGLGGALQQCNWAAFAAGYNGPAYRKNAYDTKLATAYQRYAAGNLPDLKTRAAQMLLMYRGYKVGGIDGIFGKQTQAALKQFQTDNGMPATGTLDDDTWARLQETPGP